MQISFHWPRLKIKRAYKHIEELEAWLRDLVQTNINTAMAHKDNRVGSESHTVLVQRPPSFSDDVPLIVGDAIHNLRASLDYVASTIISAGISSGIINLSEIEPAEISFPLRTPREALIKTPVYGFIKRVSPNLAAIICDVIISNMTGEKRLLGLNQLDQRDKHRFIVPTITHSNYLVIRIREEQEDDPPTAPAGAIFMLAGIAAPNGAVIREARAPRIGTRAYIHNQRNGYPSVEIKFGKGASRTSLLFQHFASLPNSSVASSRCWRPDARESRAERSSKSEYTGLSLS